MEEILLLKKEIEYLELKVKMLSVSRNDERCRNTLLNAIPDMVFLMNSSGDYIDYRGGRGELFISQSKLIGTNIKDSAISLEVIDQIISANKAAIETNTVQEIEYKLLFPDGMLRTYESRSAKYDQNHVVRIVREITARVALEKALKTYVTTLEKNSFNLSHEVRLHLSNIMGLTELLIPTELSPKANHIIEKIKESAAKMDTSVKAMSQAINSSIN